MEKADRKKAFWTFDGSQAIITFPSGLTRDFAYQTLPQPILDELVRYGFKQKMADSLAGYEGSDEDKADLLESLFGQLKDGEWTSRKEAAPRIDTSKLRANLIAQGVPAEVADKLIADSKREKKQK